MKLMVQEEACEGDETKTLKSITDGKKNYGALAEPEFDSCNEVMNEELDNSRTTTESEAEARRKKLSTVSIDGYESVPPNGGWGWVVVAASFFCLCVLDGISYTFGMFLAPLMKDMECGRSGVSAAGSLQV